MINARADPRSSVALGGKILSLQGGTAFDCVIVDLSEGGARVVTKRFYQGSPSLYLFVAKTGDLFECTVQWQRDDEMGVRFVDSPGRSRRKMLLSLCAGDRRQ